MKPPHYARRAGLSAVAIASIALLNACGAGEASVVDDSTAGNASLPVPVEITQPRRQDIYATYVASASISSDTDAPVAARVGGEIVELLVEEGDRVEIGQVMARLDGRRLRLEMLVAAANLERARKEYARNVDLHDRGLISASMFEGLKYDLAALEAGYELTQLNYGYSNIRATLSGVVSSRDIKLGESLQPGRVVFRITETSELMASLQIPQGELPTSRLCHSRTSAQQSRGSARQLTLAAARFAQPPSLTTPAAIWLPVCLASLRLLTRSTKTRWLSRYRRRSTKMLRKRCMSSRTARYCGASF